MKRKRFVSFAILCLIIAVLCWMGIGFYSSSSAVQDLKTELETIYGTEYTGKDVENGTEDMVFEIEPKTWFLTNWNLRNVLCIDYKYECNVIFTTYVDEKTKSVRTVTYEAVDPMGKERTVDRAYLDLDSKAEIRETQIMIQTSKLHFGE